MEDLPDPRRCPRCLQYTARFDPASRSWCCPCGWSDVQKGRTLLPRLLLIAVLSLGLGGCMEILSILAASGLTGWLTNRDSCTVQQTLVDGRVVAETRICSETSILPKGLRESVTPAAPVPPAGDVTQTAR